MIWVIVGGIVGLIVWFAVIAECVDDSYSETFDVVMSGFLGLLWGAIVAAIVAAALNGLMLPILHGNEAHQSATYRLQAIAARADLHGEFFLGSGQVDSDPAYRYYRTTANGGFVLDSVDATETTVYQDSSTPRLIDHWDTPKHTWWCLFSTGSESYEIHVPKGSITSSMNLDLP